MSASVNPDYDCFTADRYNRASIPCTIGCKLITYPTITGEQALAISTPKMTYTFRYLYGEACRRIEAGLD